MRFLTALVGGFCSNIYPLLPLIYYLNKSKNQTTRIKALVPVYYLLVLLCFIKFWDKWFSAFSIFILKKKKEKKKKERKLCMLVLEWSSSWIQNFRWQISARTSINAYLWICSTLVLSDSRLHGVTYLFSLSLFHWSQKRKIIKDWIFHINILVCSSQFD